MVAAKRKSLVPKNIKNMNDDERWSWWNTLTEDQQDKMRGRTFRCDPEWFVYWAQAQDDGVYESGCTHGPVIHESEESARKAYDELRTDPNVVAARIERVVDIREVFPEADLEDREYETIAQVGEFPDDAE